MRFPFLGIATVVGVANAIILLGWDTIDPRNIGWLKDDLAQAYLGWAFHRREGWTTFPLAWTGRLGYPVGVSIGLTDSIPLIAVPLRWLSDLVPDPFQYLGLYACLSLVLQACFGMLLCRALYKGDAIFTIAGGLLLALAPIFTIRFTGHFALTSQWLLLAALWAYWRPPCPGWLRPFFAILVIAGGLHPYLGVLCLLVSLSAVWRLHLEGRCSRPRGAALAMGLTATLATSLFTFGFVPALSASTYQAEGFRRFSLNLIGPLNAMGLTSFLPEFPMAWPEQYEGYSYLGAGVIGLLAAGVAVYPGRALSLVRRWMTSHSTVPLLVLAIVCTAGALSPTITLGPFILADITLPGALEALASVLRASGRLFWPVCYLLMLASLSFAFWLWSPRARYIVVVVAVLVQLVDVWPLQRYVAESVRRGVPDPLRSRQWGQLGRDHRRLMIVPPWICRHHVGDRDSFWIFGRLAATLGMQTNTYYPARSDPGEIRTHCDTIPAATMAGALDPEAAYVVNDAVLDAVRSTDQRTHRCRTVDGFHLCTRSTPGAEEGSDSRRYELGTVVDFGATGNAAPYLLFGWASPDEAGTWTDGLTASFVMRIQPRPSDALELVAVVQHIVAPWYRIRRVTVVVNDQVVAHWWLMPGERQQVRRAPVPPALARGDGLLNVRFQVANPDSPAELGLNPDHRLLGLLVRSVTLDRAERGNAQSVSARR